MRSTYYIIFVLLFSSCSIKKGIEKNSTATNEVTQLSMDFLTALKNDESTEPYKDRLKHLTIDDVDQALSNDAMRFAFWLNIYNAYIQDILKENPELYENRGDFFRKPRIEMLGRTFSFGEIEHGIIRRSQNEFGLGYLRKWFPPKWERKLRVNQRDYRIHFALNCGAKDCPPVAIYNPIEINDQLEKGTKAHLDKTSTYNMNQKQVKITSLFNWFRGDFGGKSGTRKILKDFEIVPINIKPDLKYTNYDWTLDLGNYIEL